MSAKSRFAQAIYFIGSEVKKKKKVGDMVNPFPYFNKHVLKKDNTCLNGIAICHLRGHLRIEIKYELGRQHLYNASKNIRS